MPYIPDLVPNKFIIIPQEVRNNKDLPEGAMTLWGEFLAWSDDQGYCCLKSVQLAKQYCRSSSVIKSWIEKLVKNDYIEICHIVKEGKHIKKVRIKNFDAPNVKLLKAILKGENIPQIDDSNSANKIEILNDLVAKKMS